MRTERPAQTVERPRRLLRLLGLTALLLALVTSAAPATADPALTLLSSDPYTNVSAQHRTEVEPDTFAFGTSIVSAFQVGRFNDGGADNVGWATSRDSGATWQNGFLPGITRWAGGPYDRASDPAVAYDARHSVWLIATLPISDSAGPEGAGVLVSRSGDGVTWETPSSVVTRSGLDKNWIACDNYPTSPYYGNCYVQWDDTSRSNLIQLATSHDGGRTWGAPRSPGGWSVGLGGQPVVQPSGRVVVPIASASANAIRSFTSTNGGDSWSSPVTITSIYQHRVAGSLRTLPLPSAEIDRDGKVYVAWQDCRFRRTWFFGCPANDIVLTTSTDGTAWSAVRRIPIDPTNSGVDHFIPGLAVDPDTAGSSAHLALTYYYYPQANCTVSTCALSVGYVSSTNGGSTWSSPSRLAGPMSLAWLPSTTQGRMVGDYISTSIASGIAWPVFAVAGAPESTGRLLVPMYTPTGGLPVDGGTTASEVEGAAGVPDPAAEGDATAF